jgi:hypothetical protein
MSRRFYSEAHRRHAPTYMLARGAEAPRWGRPIAPLHWTLASSASIA